MRGDDYSLLPGSPPVEGRPFVVQVRGKAGARVILGLKGAEVGAAVGEDGKPLYVADGMWGMSVQLDSEGRAQVTLQGWKSGSELTLCVLQTDLFGRLSGISGSMSVRPLPAQGMLPATAAFTPSLRVPVPRSIRPGGSGAGPSVSPTSAGVGGQVVLSGPQLAALSGYSSEDVRITNSAVSGCLGRATAVGVNSVTATITAASPFPKKGQLQVMAGDGSFISIPNFGGMTFANPAWCWSAAPGSPSIPTGTEFETTAQTVFQPCGAPDMFIDLHFRLDGGMLKAKLPGSKGAKGDVFSYDVAFELSDGLNVTPVASSHANSSGLASVNGWAVDSLFLLFPLSIGLLNYGCTAGYDAGTNEIFIAPPAGKSITAVDGVSFVHIAFDPNEHVIVTETHGVKDAYSTANGLEATTPSVAFDNWVLGAYSIPTRREYDMSGCDIYLRDTFSGYGPGAVGAVRSGNVQMHINGFGCQTNTDGIAFGWSPTPAFAWGVGLPRLEILNYTWNAGDDATLCFNLAQLPVVNASNEVEEVRNILDKVNENHLDIAVQDDTTVDYITIKVLRSKTP